ncbi:TrmB family transcriptional regulator [Halopelagius longus]|uniref:Sugar-specific transcriptional regulator TrmB n=1 Tax=Halopelagius longus TaxID=1236180 RepID=A0A1H1AY91_9EURY|nr:helix-turn-helix domain-containing protein [Halopelagius longus]RDI70563.1 TrmB family transcriptional regulator [Halopelagius longus]SDQ44688.1 Sugar-specific transcriptional regulator TrmB [Halopelagius longus]
MNPLRPDGGSPRDGDDAAVDAEDASVDAPGAAADGEHEAVESLEALGLSNYAARVFVALQKLGAGTAKEIHDLANVPRSQVYGAAEELESLGLVELQQATPKRYRPVGLDAARRRLAEELKSEADRAFDYLEAARRQRTSGETRDDVWTVRGREPANNRLIELAEQAQERVVFAAPDTDLVPTELVAVLAELADEGIAVLVVSESEAVRTRFEEAASSVTVFEPPNEPPGSDFTGRVLLVDGRVVFLSVAPEADAGEETAIWSADTPMADMLSRIIEGTLVER